MPIPLDAEEVLNREFLEVRARILQVAAALDRIERAEGSVERDPRLAQLRRALAALEGRQANRAEQVQLIFSLAYDDNWRANFGLGQRGS